MAKQVPAIVLSCAVLLAAAAGIAVSTEEVQAQIILSVLFTLGLAVVFTMSRSTMFLIAIACLPFTQAPTIKILMRIRISEVLAWISSPRMMLRGVRDLPRTTRRYLTLMATYFGYMALLGLYMWPQVAADSRVLEYLIHPALRAALEAARLVACLGLVVWACRVVATWDRLRDVLKAATLGGAFASLYGVYQAMALRSGMALPMLPGTLNQMSPRPFSTFYEPTGFGSYEAVATILSLYLATSTRGLFWSAVCFLNVVGVVMSLSAAGALALGAGLIAMVVLSPLRSTLVAPAIAVALSAALYVSTSVIGSDVTSVSTSSWWFQNRLDERVLQFSVAMEDVGNHPLGIGVGNYLLRGHGAYGASRLLVEGGVPGTLAVLLLYAMAWRAARRLAKADDDAARKLAPYAGGATAAVFAVSLNYINTTDSWLWVFMSLPIVGWTVYMRTHAQALRPTRQGASRASSAAEYGERAATAA
jgi:hypothetical protein